MPRLFTAIQIPEEIGEQLYALRIPLPGARWIQPQSYHITLRYVGEADGAVTREFMSSIAEIEHDAFEISIRGLGAFGGHDPHAVWAAVESSPALDTLARAHERAARNAGLPPESRAFKPHVTLARLKHSSPDAVARFFTRSGGYRSQPFFVVQTVLMASRPKFSGGPYSIEDRFPMRGMGAMIDDDDTQW